MYYKGATKQARLVKYSWGFALPTVLIASTLMLAVLVTAARATSITRSALTSQQYERDAQMAAEKSGVAMAHACLQANHSQVTWTDASPLRPGTDCQGNGGGGYVLNEQARETDRLRTTFTVPEPTVAAEHVLTIKATGTTERLRSSDDSVHERYEATDSMSIPGMPTVTVSGGSFHNCSIAVGQAYCWGYGSNGQLRNGSTADQTTPVAVGGDLAGKTVTSISAGNNHTCAISDGQAYCWGDGNYGLLGIGSTSDTLMPGVSVRFPWEQYFIY